MVDSDKDSVLILTNKDAPFYKMIRVSLTDDSKNGANAQVVIPEDTNRRLDFVLPVDGDKLFVFYLENVKVGLDIQIGS